MIMNKILFLSALLVGTCPVYAANYSSVPGAPIAICDPDIPSDCLKPNASGSVNISGAVAISNGSINVVPQTATGGFAAVSVGVTSAVALAVRTAPQYLLALDNESTTASLACAFGATAALNTAGSFTIQPGQTRTWSGTYVPLDAVNCIASAAATPLTVEHN